MRIIKLSPKDISFPDRSSVDSYFELELPNRRPAGQFNLTQGKIAENGITIGESIIFSYQTEITHIARAGSGKLVRSENNIGKYPFYFIIDLATVFPAQGNLADVEASLASVGIHKNIVNSRGWPRIPDSVAVEEIWKELEKLRY